MFVRVLIIISVILFLLVLYNVISVGYRVSQSKELIESTEKFSRMDGEDKAILFLGDSTAYGVGASNANATIPGLFGGMYPYDVENAAVSGYKLGDVEKSIDSVARDDYELIIMQAGGNDIIKLTSQRKMSKELDQILPKLKSKSNNVVILHTGNIGTAPFFPFPVNVLMTHRSKMIRELYIEKSKEYGVTYVDLFRDKKEDPFYIDKDTYYAKDGLHLSDSGNEFWFNSILDAMKRDSIAI